MNMNEDINNDKGRRQSLTCCLITLVFWVFVVCAIATYCSRDKSLIDSSIKSVHDMYDYADSVWHSDDSIKNIKDEGK